MRALSVLVMLCACTDAADVPSTVVHIHVSATCESPDCLQYSDVFYNDCGPIGSTAITRDTRDVEVITSYDAEDITGYVQLQYTSEQALGAGELVYQDQLLTANDTADVYSAYGGERLYTLNAAGEVTNIDATRLSAASGNTLQFRYTSYGTSAQEDHVIDAAEPVRLETDDPGLLDACCSVGNPRDAGLVLVVIVFGLRRRRRSAYSAPRSDVDRTSDGVLCGVECVLGDAGHAFRRGQDREAGAARHDGRIRSCATPD